MNSAIGALLVGAVVVTTVRGASPDQLRLFLLVMFWGIFTFFTLIKKGDPPGRLDPVSWIWVEVTIIPAIILAAARTRGSLLTGRVAAVLSWTFATLALVTACVRLVVAA